LENCPKERVGWHHVEPSHSKKDAAHHQNPYHLKDNMLPKKTLSLTNYGPAKKNLGHGRQAPICDKREKSPTKRSSEKKKKKEKREGQPSHHEKDG